MSEVIITVDENLSQTAKDAAAQVIAILEELRGSDFSLLSELLKKGGYNGTAKDLEQLIVTTLSGGPKGSIVPSSIPTGTGSSSWLATQAGTYTNFGGVVVSVNSFAVISRNEAGVFSISQTELDLSSYAKTVDLNKANDTLFSQLMSAKNLLVNPTFTNELDGWGFSNSSFSFEYVNGKAEIKTGQGTSVGIYQGLNPLEAGKYSLEVTFKKNSVSDAVIKIGVQGYQKEYFISDNLEKTLVNEFELESLTSGKIMLISTDNVNFDFEISGVFLHKITENSLLSKILDNEKILGIASDYINSVNEIIGKIIISKNSNFLKGFEFWGINNSIIVVKNENEGGVSIDTTGANDPAIFQTIDVKKTGKYFIKLKIRNLLPIAKTFRLGTTMSTYTLNLPPSSEYSEFTVEYDATSVGLVTLILAPVIDSFLSIKSFEFYSIESNSLVYNSEKIVKDLNISNLVKNPEFLLGTSDWGKNENVFDFTVENGMANINTYSNLNVALLGSAKDVYPGLYSFEIRLRKNSVSDLDFSFGTFNPTFKLISFKATKSGFQIFKGQILLNDSEIITSINAVALMLKISTANANVDVDYIKFSKLEENSIAKRIYDVEKLRYIPSKNTSPSPIKNWLGSFITKYQSRSSDVTIVQVGDSISTNLKWSPTRDDANIRPPFCTEKNINSNLEEKLRWKEQQYRRYDNGGIFTEILGGGTSLIKETDSYWGSVGGSTYYPLTKVIDSGVNSGVSFKMPINIKRISLIVHTDSQWANSTVVNISSGNGFVQVYNGLSWVEANGYSLSLKEIDSNSSLGFYTDNAQRRLSFRSLTNLTEKTITVSNIGAGRFSYWGIEYSPNEYMFTYICASKGSHGIANLERYESWMVDSFKPDLLLWQLPILNQALGIVDRGFGSKDFGTLFINKYNSFLAKGYKILPYAIWGATYSNFIDTSGNFISGLSSSGELITCQSDIANISYRFNELGVPFIDLFNRITEIAKTKSELEGNNIYFSALAGSGQLGNSFTIDGIHLNELGELIAWRFLENYFNF